MAVSNMLLLQYDGATNVHIKVPHLSETAKAEHSKPIHIKTKPQRPFHPPLRTVLIHIYIYEGMYIICLVLNFLITL